MGGRKFNDTNIVKRNRKSEVSKAKAKAVKEAAKKEKPTSAQLLNQCADQNY
jgi:hypothetical protein